MIDSCQSWILPVAAAVLAIHHRGLWCEAAPFLSFFFSGVTQSLSVVLFLGLFQLFILSRSMVPVFF